MQGDTLSQFREIYALTKSVPVRFNNINACNGKRIEATAATYLITPATNCMKYQINKRSL